MLIKLLKDWSFYYAGQVVDVYGGVGKDLIAKGIGFDAEKPILIPSKKAEKTPETPVEEAGEGESTPEAEESILEPETPTQLGDFSEIKEVAEEATALKRKSRKI
ncbi:MAG TPA: hypothetical protein VMY59_04620 [Candidatus Thermoplasmatota archaeon]|nr:hypothetical protein [Candidatus Thermoplasmatota archaeon]